MSAHTPGPWTPGSSMHNGIHCIDAIDPVDGQLFELCEVWGVNRDTEECDVSRANARLIAAAPELLLAVQSLMNLFEQHEVQARIKSPVGDYARAAIAKATGGEA